MTLFTRNLRPRLARLRVLSGQKKVGGMGIVVAVVLSGCGSSSNSLSHTESNESQNPFLTAPPPFIPAAGGHQRLVAVQWRAVDLRDGNVLEIRSNHGYCAGRESPPQFAKVEVAYRTGTAYITAYIPARRQAPKGSICSDIGYVQDGLVRLRYPLEGLRFVDASAKPPALRSLPDSRD